ncbi:DNA helicase [Arthrobacter phage CallieOMalley]|uniref:DNA helicase n=1 Tax=Arthrobacter phage CallieOMalley TaxID=2488955 RepID=A0A3G8FSE1_9CAUD|nr:DNA helicase [Arthrobacter phage CallieOMalley]
MDPDREKGPLRRRAWPGQISSSNRSVRWTKQPKRDHRSGDGYQRRHVAGPTEPVVTVSGELDSYTIFRHESEGENPAWRAETYTKTGPGAYRVVSRVGGGREPLHEGAQYLLDEERRAAFQELRIRPRNDRNADPELGTRDVHGAAGAVPGEGQKGWPSGVVLEVGGGVVRSDPEPAPGAREGDRAFAGLPSGLLRPSAVPAVRTLYELHGREPRGPFFETAEGRLLGPAPGYNPGDRGTYEYRSEEALPGDEETLHDGSGRQRDSVLVNWSETCRPGSDISISVALKPGGRAEGWEVRAAEIRPRKSGKTYLGLSALSGCCGGVCGCGKISGGFRCYCTRWERQDGQWKCSPGFQGWETGRAGGVVGDGFGRAAAYGRGYGDLCRDFLQAVSERASSAACPPARSDSPGDYQGLYNSGYRRCEQTGAPAREDHRPDPLHVRWGLQEIALNPGMTYLGWLDRLARRMVD